MSSDTEPTAEVDSAGGEWREANACRLASLLRCGSVAPDSPYRHYRRRPALSHLTNEELVKRIRGEFLEMPGLVLTARQAERFWGLDTERCQALLAILIQSGFLTVTRNGAFIRADVNSPAYESSDYSFAEPPAGVAG